MAISTNKIYWNTDRIMKLIIAIAITIALVFLIQYLHSALLPFIVACFLAYLLQPLVNFNQKWTHEKGRTISSILAVLEVAAVITLLIFIFLPHVINELDSLQNIIHELETGKRTLPPEFAGVVNFVKEHVKIDDIKSILSNLHLESLINRGTSLLGESIAVILEVLSWALTLIYLLFILIDYPQIVRGFKLIFPYKYRAQALEVVRDVQQNMDHYFRGQGFLALCAMVGYCIGFSIIGLPLAIPMGLLVGILYMIPYFQYITIVPIAIICLIYSLGGAAEFMPMFGKSLLIFLIVQPICDYVITPHVMGKEMGLNPAMILLSLSIWGSLLGIIGMIIALPATSLIMTYYERYISNPTSSATK